jgi:CubicO group peptidase (beta-lactamase class C family)
VKVTAPRSRTLLAMLAVAVAILVVLLSVLRRYQHERAQQQASSGSYLPRELLAGGHQAPSPHVTPQSEQLDPQGLQAAADYAGEHQSLALIVSRHGYIVFERYWRGSGFDTLTDAQSFTPLLAALATGVALSHRMIGWPDEPVSAFIGEWSQDPRGAITLRNLMQMTSGLAPAAGGTSAGLIAWTLAASLARPPGSVRREQAVDPQLLSLVLERATQQRYASYLSQTLWRRIGAADAWLWLDREGGSAHADCCMLARQGDWIRLAELLLRDGNYQGSEVIRPGWVAFLRAPAKAAPGYGAFLRLAERAPGQEPYAEPDVFVAGGTGGNRLWLVPSLQIAILSTAAKEGRDASFDEARVPNLIIRAARDYVPPAPPPADVSSMVPGHRP